MGLDAVQGHVAGLEATADPVSPGQVAGVDVAEQAVIGVVGQCHRLVVVVVGQDHHHRTERLLAYHGHVSRAVGQQGRGHKPTAQIGSFTATHQRCPGLHPGGHKGLHPVPLRLRDERTDQGPPIGGIPRNQHPGHHSEGLHRTVVNAAMADHPGGGGTDLPAVEPPHRGDGPYRGVHVSVVSHHQGALAS